MKTILCILAVLTAVSGGMTPASASAEPEAPVCLMSGDHVDSVPYLRPQTRAWFVAITGYGSLCPPAFQKVVSDLDDYWDEQAAQNCSSGGCRPRFGGVLTSGACSEVKFHRGDVFWGGFYNPNALPVGTEPIRLSPDGWVGVYRVTAASFSIPVTANCVGGRWLRELKFVNFPLIRR